MALVLPYPNTPLNGQPGDPVPINANFTAIAQAIQSFDGSQIAAGTVVSAALNSSINPVTRDNLILRNFVSSGCVWSSVSGLSGTMSSGTLFINGIMVTVNGVISKTFTASKDTYVDIDYNGNVYYQEVSNNASSPSITANSIRVAIVVTSGSAIGSVNQGSTAATAPVVSSNILAVCDTLGNLIYPTDPMGKLIGYRQITSSFTGVTATSATLVTGLFCPVIVPTGRKVKIYTKGDNMANSTAAQAIFLGVYESTTQLGLSQLTAPGNSYSVPANVDTEISPTSGLHTYQTDFWVGANTGALNCSSTSPAFIRVELG